MLRFIVNSDKGRDRILALDLKLILRFRGTIEIVLILYALKKVIGLLAIVHLMDLESTFYLGIVVLINS